MALVLADRVLETTAVAGTGDASLGGAVTGYQPFSTIGGGNTTYYTIVAIDANGTPTGDWEVGIGTYVTTGNKITRDTVLSSSNGGALVYFPSGTKQIFLDLPSEEVLLTAGNVYGPASAVNSNFALYDGTTGKLLKDAGINASTFATAAQGAKADTAVQPGSLGTAAYLNAGAANGVATLDSGGKVPVSQIPQMGDLNYQGTWDAYTNTPTLVSSSGTKGYYYVVSVAGSTNLNGITDWKVGDWAVFNGSVWQKIDNTDAVTSVNGYTGTVVLTYTDVGAQPAGSYAPATSGTSILYGNGSGGFSNVTVGSGLSFSTGTLSATSSMVYPGAGIPNSTGTAWGTSYTTTGSGTIVALQTNPTLYNPNIDVIDFDTAYATTLTAGQMGWDGNNTLGLGMAGGNVIQHIGEDTFLYAKASSAITKGQLCMFTGVVGASSLITVAPSTGVTNGQYIIGVAAESIALNGFGLIQIIGNLKGLDTSAFADGDILYYNSAVTGGFTTTLPTSGPIVTVAAVTHASNGGSGSLQIRVSVTQRITAGTAISVSQTASGTTITNTAPDQTVAITGAGGAVVTGTYPNFTITTPSGTVTSVTGTSPIASTGGATPAISISQANTTTNGYLSSTDWNTFNSKQPAGTYVTAVTVVSANGFTGTSSGGATPALTLGTSITGLLKGNGTAISAATSGTDYAPATSGSSILYGNGAGGFSNVTVGTGLSFAAGTLSATASGVTSIAGTTNQITASASTGAVTLSVPSTFIAPGSIAATTTVTGTGVIASNGIVENSATISANYTIGTGNNAVSTGPITVASGITVTVPTGSTWVVL